jgi:hypothetical protein
MEDPKVDKYTDKAQPGQEVSEKDSKAVANYVQVLTELLHSPKSRDSVTDTLTSAQDPFLVIPQTAMSTNDMGVNLMKQSGIEVPFGIQLAASTYLISDLIHLGYAAAGWEQLEEEDIASIYEDTIQMVIERGLEDGSIDPIQLQLEVEPMLDENQRAGGDALAQQTGLGNEPSQGAMVNQHVDSKMREKEGQMAKEQALGNQQKMQSASNEQALQGGPR